MYNVLSITLPFFALIFLGTFFSYKKVFNNDSAKTLTKFALFVTLPPFMFVNIVKSSSKVVFDLNFIIPYEIITIIILILGFSVSYYFLKNSIKVSSIFALNSAYPNYGYMGLPLCILAFSEKAAIPISIILIVDSIVLLSFVSLFVNNNYNNFFMSFIKLIFNLLRNPILLGSITGIFFISFDIKLHIIFFDFLNLLAKAATPTALFAIGINLYSKIEKNSFNQIIYVTLFKLFLHPLLVFLIFYILNLSVDILWIKVAILCASLPVAGNVFAMSIYYNSFIKETSSSIMITTLIATFTTPLVLLLLLNYY
ncbi:MAG: hypothetical protein CFH14_01173 [Alphaproteobacteria bacterium MarineAlpha5_Bin4]|nr:MAG: hypothetical protein CFH14_01173 [Alphaproteobacteria bacterium MarineAlpha5_Bin4]|tara:strand:- start:13 stop:948 length:936 start_codon:yes stop_codon:yes gene_type:complete